MARIERVPTMPLEGDPQPAYLEGACTTETLAMRAALTWKSVPSNRMQLPDVHKVADADGDNKIDKDEWEALLEAAGAGGMTANERMQLFAQVDKDGSGEIDIEELRALADLRKKQKALSF